jgi:hypothetical protein
MNYLISDAGEPGIWEEVAFLLPESLSQAFREEADKQQVSSDEVMETLLDVLLTLDVVDLVNLEEPSIEGRSSRARFLVESKCLEFLFGAIQRSRLSQSQIMSRVLYALLVTKELKIVVSDWKVKLQRKRLSPAKSKKLR